MEFTAKAKQVHLPVPGLRLERIQCGDIVLRMASPIAKAYAAMDGVCEAKKAVWCGQIQHRLLNTIPGSICVVDSRNHTARSELRFKVGFRCVVGNSRDGGDALITNISRNGLLIHSAGFKKSDLFFVQIPALQKEFKFGSSLLYKTVCSRGEWTHAELQASHSDAEYALAAFLCNMRWCNQLDQRDVFLWFIQGVMQEIIRTIEPGQHQGVAFHQLCSEAVVFSTQQELPEGSPFLDGFVSVRSAELNKRLSALKQYSPHLYQRGVAIAQSRLRYILW